MLIHVMSHGDILSLLLHHASGVFPGDFSDYPGDIDQLL